MKNMKFWRTALVVTLVLTIMLSVTGGTIAWFTDSVESGANVIKAGNLDVELYRSTTNVPEEKVTTSTKLFTVPTLWEPGAVAYENLKVVNEGDLYLYFDLGINFTGVNTVKDTEYGLDDVLKVAVVEGGVSGDREDMLAAAQAAGGKTLGSLVEKQELAPGASKTYGVVIYWETSANDNNWNLNNGKETSDGAEYLNIDLGIELFATQFDYESDSFGPEYDEDAKVSVYNEADLKAAIANGGTVKLGGDIALSSYVEIPAGVTVTLDLGGNTLSTVSGNVLRNNGTLTVNGNGALESGSTYALNSVSGTVVVNDISTKGGIFNGGQMTINNSTVKNVYSGKHGVYHGGSSLVINGGSFETTSGNELIHGAAGNAVINGGSFTQAGKAYMLKNVTVNGGNFYGYVNADGSNDGMRPDVIVKGGTFNFDPTAWLAPNHTAVNNGNGTWTVNAPAPISYAEFNAALKAAANNVYDGGGIKVILKDSERSHYNNKTCQFFIGADDWNGTNQSEAITVTNVHFVFEDDDTANAYVSGELQVFAQNMTFAQCTFENVAVCPWGDTNIGCESALIDECKFMNVQSRYGVHQNQASTLTVTNCVFQNCERGIHTNSSKPESVTITGNTFTGIGAGYGMLCLAENGDYTNATLNITNNNAAGQVCLRQLNRTVTAEQVAAILNNNTYGEDYVSGSIIPQ